MAVIHQTFVLVFLPLSLVTGLSALVWIVALGQSASAGFWWGWALLWVLRVDCEALFVHA
jgi:hypothetical protein